MRNYVRVDPPGGPHMSFRRRMLEVTAALVFLAGLGGRALAQQETTPPAPVPCPSAGQPATPDAAAPTDARPRSAEEEITVTGSRIRRKDLTTPAPVTVISRQQFEASGKMTIGYFLQTLPEQGNAPNFQLNTGGINYGADGTTRI